MFDRVAWLAGCLSGFILLVPAVSLAQAQAQAAPVTATCKDGTNYSGTKRSGACHGHGGVQSWTTASTAAPSGATPSKAPAQSAATTGSGISSSPTRPAPTTAARSGTGGPGQVWVNTASKVYHCPGDHYYGKTKQGQYMSESAAQSAGARPSGGKACS